MKTKILIQLIFSSIILLSCTAKAITQVPVSVSSTEEKSTVTVPKATAITTSINNNSLAKIPVCPKDGSSTSAPTNFGILGTIIYQDRFQGLYTVGGNPLSYSKLPVAEEQKYSTFGFSPDGNWFAFSPIEYSPTDEIIFDPAKIILFSAEGEMRETTLSIQDFVNEPPVGFRLVGFSGYSYWINNTTIYAALYASTWTPNSTGTNDDLPKVMDPFAGVWREDLLKDIPEDAKSLQKGISPDLTRILYEDIGDIVLKNLENGNDIWRDRELHTSVFGPLMFWSPDSETVVFANQFVSPEDRAVILISRDGGIKSIIGPSLSLSELLVEDVQWSPDGHSLAVLAWEGEGKGDAVYIYDVAAERFISRCPIANSMDMHAKIIWSPDNKYLAYSALEYPLTIMEVQSGEIFQLADNARAVGWSEKFPVIWTER
jgi:hypothetical protein